LRDGAKIVFSTTTSSFSLLDTDHPVLGYTAPVISFEDSVCFAFEGKDLIVFLERLKILRSISDELHFSDDRCFSVNDFGTKFEVALPVVSGSFADNAFSCGLLIDFFEKIAGYEDPTFDVRVYIPDIMVIVYGGLRFYIGPLLDEPLQLTLNPHI